MDANGTRYHLVLRREEWLAEDELADAVDVDWDATAEQLTLRPLPVRLTRSTATGRLSLDDRRGGARDRHGAWWSIGADGRSLVVQHDPSTPPRRAWPEPRTDRRARPTAGGFVPAAAPTPAPPARLRGLGVSHEQYLLVGAPQLGQVLVFDLHGGGDPWPLDLPEPVALLDVATAPTGEVWLLERPDDTPPRLWLLDRQLRPCALTTRAVAQPTTDFRPADATDTAAGDEPVEVSGPIELAGDPVAVVALGDGRALVLDRAPDAAVLLVSDEDDAPPQRLPLDAFEGVPHDLVVVDRGDRRRREPDTVAVVDDRADLALAYAVDAGGARLLARVHLPMFASTTGALAETSEGPHYESAGRFTPLVDQRRVRYVPSGSVDTAPLDGGEHGCVWHRLAIDGCVPPGARLAVWSRTADDADGLGDAPWQPEPSPYLRRHGAELAWYEPPRDAQRGEGTWELLFQHAVGRWLQLRLELVGDGQRSPRLSAARVHHPRFSYLANYLPAVYAADRTAASFLERLLANVEGEATRLEDRVAEAQRLHDVDTAPDEALDWLASWIGATLDPDAPAADRRLVLRHAADLFRERGTRPGLLRTLRLATCPPTTELLTADPTEGAGFTVRVVEGFATRTLPAPLPWRALDRSELDRPRLVAPSERWRPGDGRDVLIQRWRAYLDERGADPDLPVPIAGRGGPAAEAAWAGFARDRLAVAWAETGPGDAPAWRAFVERRHGTVAALRRAWGQVRRRAITAERFADLDLPETLPTGHAFRDWVDFVTVALPSQRAAHRLEVLVPVRFDDPPEVRRHRLDRATAATAAHCPAHVRFEVRSYWAACRVGACRVGHETIVGEGSRYAAIALGRTALARGRLTDPGLDDTRRSRTGRDAVGAVTVGAGPSPTDHEQREPRDD